MASPPNAKVEAAVSAAVAEAAAPAEEGPPAGEQQQLTVKAHVPVHVRNGLYVPTLAGMRWGADAV